MIARLARDIRAVSATEFAIVLPFLVILYLGGYQLSDAISAYRKVSTATRTVADLTSQFSSVSDSDLDTVLAASQQVMTPYKVANAQLTVSQIVVSDKGVVTVDWSRGLNTTALKAGDPYTLPASIKQNSTSLIVATIRYNYVPLVAPELIGTIPMRDDIIMSPRGGDSVKKKTA
ncbi:MAG: TadE/TadG family type IV pilus assembly protein [Sphingomonas sp.]